MKIILSKAHLEKISQQENTNQEPMANSDEADGHLMAKAMDPQTSAEELNKMANDPKTPIRILYAILENSNTTVEMLRSINTIIESRSKALRNSKIS